MLVLRNDDSTNNHNSVEVSANDLGIILSHLHSFPKYVSTIYRFVLMHIRFLYCAWCTPCFIQLDVCCRYTRYRAALIISNYSFCVLVVCSTVYLRTFCRRYANNFPIFSHTILTLYYIRSQKISCASQISYTTIILTDYFITFSMVWIHSRISVLSISEGTFFFCLPTLWGVHLQSYLG